jgi:hypothetical protein
LETVQVRGYVLSSLKRFVGESYGTKGSDAWMMFMPACSSAFYRKQIDSDAWYPMQKALLIPLEWMCALFHDGELFGARKFGHYLSEKHPVVEQAVLSTAAPGDAGQAEAVLQVLFGSGAMDALIAILPGQRSERVHPALENLIGGCLERSVSRSGEDHLRNLAGASLVKVEA